MEVEIREATEADAGAIREIMQDAFHKYENDLGMKGHVQALSETEDDIQRDIRHKTVLVGLVDGVPVGSVRVEMLGSIAYLSRFGVCSAITKSGIGGMLIDRVETLCREQSPAHFFPDVRPDPLLLRSWLFHLFHGKLQGIYSRAAGA